MQSDFEKNNRDTMDYNSQLKKLHENPGFGVGKQTEKHYKKIFNVLQARKVKSVLDYGCGKGNFLKAVKDSFPSIKTVGYDIANEEFSKLPDERFEVTVCLDVMEHIEYGSINKVLQQIRNRTEKVFICSIANYPASAILPDGRNAHITQMPFGYWFTTLSGFFRVDDFMRTQPQEALFMCSAMAPNADWR